MQWAGSSRGSQRDLPKSIMPGYLAFCLVSALLTVGSALVCETCSSKSATCSGPLQTCNPSEDVCLSHSAEYKFAARIFARSYKECASSATCHSCSSLPFTMRFRPSISMRTYFHCCKNDSCNTSPPESSEGKPIQCGEKATQVCLKGTGVHLSQDTKEAEHTRDAGSKVPPYPEELNGLECPSCFALGVDRCLNIDTMPCRGKEDHCFEISGTLMAGNFNFTKTAAGCATAGVCSKKLGVYNYSKAVVDIVTKFVCYPASTVAAIKTEL